MMMMTTTKFCRVECLFHCARGWLIEGAAMGAGHRHNSWVYEAMMTVVICPLIVSVELIWSGLGHCPAVSFSPMISRLGVFSQQKLPFRL